MTTAPTTRRPLRTAASTLMAPLFALVAACGVEQGDTPHAQELGDVAFNASCAPAAASGVDRALALLHHMMYVEAEREFRSIAASDPGCAMAHWGVAMAQFQPLWPGQPSADALAAGREALRAAREAGPGSAREEAYIEVLESFFADERVDYAERLRRFEAGMQRVAAAYPEDRDAAAFLALALLSTAPVGDAELTHQRRAAEILSDVFEASPRHPGAVHYAIHAHDVTHREHGGVEFAQSYEHIAPDVPHALHMPSHIYVRLGGWPEVIDWNRRSADAALEFPAGEFVSHHHPHALDYLMYAYLQQTRDGAAAAVETELAGGGPYQETFISAYALAAIPARLVVERRDWAAAAALPEREPGAFPWDGFPGAEAMTYFARGLGAANVGDVEAARRAAERLGHLEAAATAAGDAYWATQIEIQRTAVDAWTAKAEGRLEDAVRLMRTAAEMEAGTEKHPVTPGALQPAYELLGDLLLALDEPREALSAYEQSMEVWPGRYNSLLGAARAAAALGEEDTARRYYTDLLELAAEADAARDGLEEARAVVER